MTVKLFIDGEAGTTGLGIRERLVGRDDIEILTLIEADRKDKEARRDVLNSADIVILCLPDDAAKEAVKMIENKSTRVIDASTAHRISEGWVYGFPEYNRMQSEIISNALRVSNPGCYALTAVSIIRPLIESGVIPTDWPVSINAISGYSGGGRKMIETFEGSSSIDSDNPNFFFYGLSMKHKHVPEITLWSGLKHPPIFSPSVGQYRQGMIVQIPIAGWALPSFQKIGNIYKVYKKYYSGYQFVTVVPISNASKLDKLDPEILNGTNSLHIYIFGNEDTGQIMVVGLLDNLGKGASGQAVQNLNLMIGASENKGLVS